MEEKMFFNEGGISVSNSRFIAEGQTYAMSGITSVRSFQKDPSRKGPIILGIIGILALFGSISGGDAGSGIIGALVFVGGAAAWWFYQKSEFSVLLSSASGDTKALKSQDSLLISRVVSAINDAIVHRG